MAFADDIPGRRGAAEPGGPGATWPPPDLPGGACRCNLPACRSGWPEELIEEQADRARAMRAAWPREAEAGAWIRAVAREHGDELDEAQASEALGLYAVLTASSDDRVASLKVALRRHQHKLTEMPGEVCAGPQSDWPCPHLTAWPPGQIEAGA